MSESDNLPQVIASLKAKQERMDIAIGTAATEISLALENRAKNQIKGDRKNQPYPAISGQPPMNVTGNLRRSIKASTKRLGFMTYVAEAGAFMVYARAVELGGAPTWTNGQHFPYMEPALKQVAQSGIIKRILAKHLGRA